MIHFSPGGKMAATALSSTDQAAANLPEPDKERIRNQEAFRLIVQKQLVEPKPASRAGAVLDVLNNSFTIFLLSSVLLPGTAWLHANTQAAERTKAALIESAEARENRIEKLDSEIAFRFSRTLAQLAAANATSEPERAALINGALASLTTRIEGGDMQTLYPAFANQSALSLMSDLRSERIAAGAHSEKMTPTVDGTVSRAIKLLSIYGLIDRSGKSPKDVAGELIQIMSSPKLDNGTRRWDKEFAYTDCTPNNPFC
jgi:hypothetical protein